MKYYDIGESLLYGNREKNFIGALIGAGASLAGGAMSAISQGSANKANKQIAEMNNKANQQLQDSQNKWNLEQWNRENEYNSAKSQRSRLEEAGYNPYMASGQVAAGSATSSQLQSAPYTPMGAPTMQPVTGLAQGISNAGNDLLTGYLNTQMTKSQVDNLAANAEKTRAEAQAISGYKKQESESNTARNRATSELAQYQTKQIQLNNELTRTFGNAERTTALVNAMQSAAESQSRTNMNRKSLDKIASEVILNMAKTSGQKLTNDQIHKMTPVLVQAAANKAEGEHQRNRILANEADYDDVFGDLKRDYARQHLKSESSIKTKDDQYYWWNVAKQSTQGAFDVAKKFGVKKGSR